MSLTLLSTHYKVQNALNGLPSAHSTLWMVDTTGKRYGTRINWKTGILGIKARIKNAGYVFHRLEIHKQGRKGLRIVFFVLEKENDSPVMSQFYLFCTMVCNQRRR